MFEWLFPGWSNPLGLTAFVGLRILLNVALTVLAARAVGRRAATTVAMAAGTALSAAMVVLLLRPGVLGYTASFVELGVQLAIVVLGGYVAYVDRSTGRRVVTTTALVAALALLLFTIPLYGEAFVAP
ncbi:hypothetical protein [Haloprofundus sp. MHR1]|uniref:hypothetical protein n=1 Tax=Haloprofundus sp. MHR1 TaxID=2572921 RepID=UPI0010BED065|nr:hypothetical protein [Haloprofundus sp. MHR1]QCJ46066.1 hypothetical protein FCF25_02550 [Haloprofundus sp. MHR1]